MVRKLIYGMLLLVVIVAACAGALVWLVTTEAGARRVGAFLAGQIGAEVGVRKVEGSILAGLSLEDAEIRRKPFQVQIKNVRVRWLPFSVFSGWTRVNELSVKGVTINDGRPVEAAPSDLKWPTVPAMLAAVSFSVESLTVDDIAYARSAGPPLVMKVISGSISWARGRLEAKKVSVAAPAATITGEVTAGFREPALGLDLSVALAPAVAGTKNVYVNVRPVTAREAEQVAGEMTMTLVSTSGRRSDLAGGIGLTRSSLSLKKFHLTQAGRKGAITGEGDLTFSKGDVSLTVRAKLNNLDLGRELRATTNLTGALSFTGKPARFQGDFDLANAGNGWQAAHLSGSFSGNTEEVNFPALEGAWLAGKVKGGLKITSKEGVFLRVELEGRGLQPSLIAPEWTGVANLTLGADLRWSERTPLEGIVRSRLLESSLAGQPLTGEVTARLSGGELSSAELTLRGRGFDVHASGRLRSRIVYRADIDDLVGLVPGAHGRLRALGWVQLRNGLAAFTVQGSGKAIAAYGAHVDSASFDLALDPGKDRTLRGSLKAAGLTYGRFRLASAALTAQGPLSRHIAAVELRSSQAEIRASLSGAYLSGSWQGKVQTLTGRDPSGGWRLETPVDLKFSETEISLSPVALQGSGLERVEVRVNLLRRPRQGALHASWRDIHLGRAGPWLKDLVLTGSSAGNAEVAWQKGDLSRLAADLDATGTVTSGEFSLGPSRAAMKLSWDNVGLVATGEIDMDGGGRFNGRLSAASPVRFAVPENGEMEAQWREIDVSLFRKWLPRALSLKGRLDGQVKGKLSAGGRPDLSGNASLTGGSVGWQRERGQLSASLKQTALSLTWEGETVRGEAEATLDDYGQAHVVYSLPIPARLPPFVNGKGNLSVALKGRLKEKGMVSAAFPGLIEESRGEVNLALNIGGTWDAPVLGGNAQIADAGAYLPSAGIKLRSLSLKAHLEGEQVFLDSLRVESGPGSIELAAVIGLNNGVPGTYRGTLKGARFQTIYLPELQVSTNPALTFSGTPDRLTIRGLVAVPELKALGGPGPAPVTGSKDIVILDAPKEKKKLPLALDLRVSVVLGDNVTFKDGAADMKLEGAIDVSADDPGDIKAKGAIRIVKGTYSAQGINLNVTQGRLVFDGPADSPNLDILAVRKVEDKTVGVLITGVAASPVIKLYSQPPMPDPDIMSYLVLGRSLPAGGGDISLMVNAAQLLLSRGEARSFQDQLKRHFGLDLLDIQVSPEKAAATGPGKATVKGQAGPATQAVVSQSVVTIGKYLTPKLYLSYGRSLFTDVNVLKLRYKFSEQWELETQSGVASGGDIFYKIEFQ